MKRIVIAAVALAAAVLSATPAHASPPRGHDPVLRVATYNIHAGAGNDGVFDIDRTAAQIAELDADVVALQEVDVHWNARSQWRDLAAELAESLDMSVFFGPIYSVEPTEPGAPKAEYGNALLSRYPIRASRNHEITRLSTQVPNPVPEPAPGFPQISIKVDGVDVDLYSTHLDYRGVPDIRQAQVLEMLDIMACKPHRPQVLMGDFNVGPDGAELAPLWSTLTDAWAAAGTGDGLTYPADVPTKRIDYIAVSSQVSVTGVEAPQSLGSDHRPVVADLVIRR